MALFRIFTLISLCSSHITIISIFQAVVWFKQKRIPFVLAVLNFSFIAAYIPECIIDENKIECIYIGIILLILAVLDFKLFIVHPYEVEAAVNVEQRHVLYHTSKLSEEVNMQVQLHLSL